VLIPFFCEELGRRGGGGRAEMQRHLSKLSMRFDAVLSIYKAKRQTSPISCREITDLVEDRLATAMFLSDKGPRKIKKLAIAQDAAQSQQKGIGMIEQKFLLRPSKRETGLSATAYR
jgi:hypothetical protein